MIKYKIIDTLAEHLDKQDAEETLHHMQLLNPDKKLEIQEYNLIIMVVIHEHSLVNQVEVS